MSQVLQNLGKIDSNPLGEIKGYVREHLPTTIERTAETEPMYQLRDALGGEGIPLRAANIVALEIFRLQKRVNELESAKRKRQ